MKQVIFLYPLCMPFHRLFNSLRLNAYIPPLRDSRRAVLRQSLNKNSEQKERKKKLYKLFPSTNKLRNQL